MRRKSWMTRMILIAALFVFFFPCQSPAQQKKLVYWTHLEQHPHFNKWYETKGKEFAKKTGYEVEAVVIPYQGYEAKYLAAFLGRSGAPDFFNGMTHQWCGQYDFCDKMPADLAKTWDENLPAYMVPIGNWQGARYGVPIDNRCTSTWTCSRRPA
jgi:ABC-type glycerol-3-phosphate transport system substrate-binding protein